MHPYFTAINCSNVPSSRSGEDNELMFAPSGFVVKSGTQFGPCLTEVRPRTQASEFRAPSCPLITFSLLSQTRSSLSTSVMNTKWKLKIPIQTLIDRDNQTFAKFNMRFDVPSSLDAVRKNIMVYCLEERGKLFPIFSDFHFY